jgi:hypothetical protein
MSEWRSVTKEEFDAWIAAYPRKLTYNVTRTCEPENHNWNDFSLAPAWPESMVAMVSGPTYPPQTGFHDYRVRDEALK